MATGESDLEEQEEAEGDKPPPMWMTPADGEAEEPLGSPCCSGWEGAGDGTRRRCVVTRGRGTVMVE